MRYSLIVLPLIKRMIRSDTAALNQRHNSECCF